MFGKKIKKTIKVDGMHCGHCTAKVEAAIGAIDGVKSVKADFTDGTVVIVSKEDINPDLISSAVENAGFKVIE